MFTQSAPTLFSALQGVLPDNAVRALAQALGNCQQPLTHRGPVNLSAAQPTNNKGVLSGGTWNPQFYQNNVTTTADQYYYEAPGVGGYTNGNWYSTTYGGPQFSFPMSQEFAANSYYGGPTFNVGGNSFFQNIYSDGVASPSVDAQNVTTERIVTNYINNAPYDPPGTGPSQIGESPNIAYALGGATYDYSSGMQLSGGASGRAARKRVVTDVLTDVSSLSVSVPVITKATLNADCTIELTEDIIDMPLQGQLDVSTETLNYLEPT